MSKKNIKKNTVEVTVPIIEDVSIVDSGDGFHFHVCGEAYKELMKTELAFPELAGNAKALAVFALTAAASMLSKQLIAEVEKSVLDGAAPAP